MACPAYLFFSFSLLQLCFCYFALDSPTYNDLTPRFPIPRPHQLPSDIDFGYGALPSMITAIAPSATIALNGTWETMYSMHYHHHFVRTKVGKGVFRRGVFANDPPVATCTPCGFQGTLTMPNATATGTTASCKVTTYDGVFRSKIGSAASSSASYCFNSDYSGALQPTTTSTGLPCCFTIPAHCRSNSSTSISYTYTTGVFRSSMTISYLGNLTEVSSTSTTASPSNSIGLSTPVVTSSLAMSILAPVSATSMSAINSVTVTSSSTVIVSISPSRPSASETLSIVTVPPTSNLASTPVVTTISNTIEGCGMASGSGVIYGSGTVYVAGGLGVVSSGTISGYATKVVGCGTILATTGSFSGSATIIGCGSGSGYATLDGTGVVYPAALGGLVGITSSGRITGSGAVSGCGTIIGSGTFTATEGYVTTISQNITPRQTTIEVYLSYCPTLGAGDALPKFGGNLSSPATVSYYPVGSSNGASLNSISLNTTLDFALCHVCPNDAGICCPLETTCEPNGHCPWNALMGAGYVLAGMNVVAVRNSTGSGG